MMNVVKIADHLIVPCLKKLLEIVFVMLKDIDEDINSDGERLNADIAGIVKNMGDEVKKNNFFENFLKFFLDFGNWFRRVSSVHV